MRESETTAWSLHTVAASQEVTMKKTFSVLAVVGGCLLACGNDSGGGGGSKGSIDGLINTAAAAEHRDDDRDRKSDRAADSSPFVVGVWKLVRKGPVAVVDTEFRFINPTSEALTLEYAFFENNGNFCGCDRDDFAPNQTTEYTMNDETKLDPPLPGGPRVFTCTGTSGALKSIVFKNKGQRIFLDDAMQIGFQLHAFGNLIQGDPSAVLLGSVISESPLQGIALNDSTREEIRAIHDKCVTVNGPL
jgi:hypothetical protein